MMVEPSFNELTTSTTPKTAEQIDSIVTEYVDLLQQLKKYGIKKVRYFSPFRETYIAKDYSLEDYCGTYLYNRQYANSEQQNRAILLLAMQMYPAFQGKSEEDKYDEWDDVTYTYQEASTSKECSPNGLYQAYLFDSFAVGFNQGVVDKKCTITLKRNEKKEDGTIRGVLKQAEIFNITCNEQCLRDYEFAEYMSQYPIKITPKTKKTSYSLPHHHGHDRYGDHADMLFRDEYVVDVLSTIPFNRSEKEYIHAIHDDGRVEVRLHWEEEGYGLMISTMGDDLIQTYWIAKHLEQKYSR